MNELKKVMMAYGNLVFPIEGTDKKYVTPLVDRQSYENFRKRGIPMNPKEKTLISWKLMSKDWKNWCRKKFWFQNTMEEAKGLYPAMDERLFTLKDKLLSFAGNAVCLPDYEEDLENILDYGQFWIGYTAELVKGQACHCHANASRIWEKNKDTMTICTGYALSDDGMWRQHSWVAQKQPCMHQIIETTERRVLYFGFAMTPELCENFAKNNY